MLTGLLAMALPPTGPSPGDPTTAPSPPERLQALPERPALSVSSPLQSPPHPGKAPSSPSAPLLALLCPRCVAGDASSDVPPQGLAGAEQVPLLRASGDDAITVLAVGGTGDCG